MTHNRRHDAGWRPYLSGLSGLSVENGLLALSETRALLLAKISPEVKGYLFSGNKPDKSNTGSIR
jgi:hypothetical protein